MHRSLASIWYKMAYNRFIPAQWLNSVQAVQPQQELQMPLSRQSQNTGYEMFTNSAHSYQTNGLPQNYSTSQHDSDRFHDQSSHAIHREEYSYKNDNTENNERTKNCAREQPRASNLGPPQIEQYKWGMSNFDHQSPNFARENFASHDFSGSSANPFFNGSYCHSYSTNHNHPYKRTERHQRNWQRRREYHSSSPHHGKYEAPSPRGCRDVATSSVNAFQPQSDQHSRLSRTWEEIGTVPKFSDMAKKIRVVSYNILSQKLLDINRSLYRKCDRNILPWDYRWKNLSKELRDLNADILCLQEVEKYHYRKMISQCLTDNGYELIYKKRTSENENKPDGVLIAFKHKHFKLIASKKVEYYRGEHKLLNQHNVGVVALLKLDFQSENSRKMESGCVCVVNTHLLYSPKRGDVKLVQLATLFSEVHKLINEHTDGNVPIILCGDFNSIPSSVIFKFITEQEICYKDTDSKLVSGQQVSRNAQVCLLPDPLLPESLNISQECLLQPDDESQSRNERLNEDAIQRKPYYLRHSLGPLASVHDHTLFEASTTQDHGITVDYIFHSPQTLDKNTKANTTSLYPLRRLPLVSPDDLHSVSSVPNAAHSSDHLPIAADFMVVRS